MMKRTNIQLSIIIKHIPQNFGIQWCFYQEQAFVHGSCLFLSFPSNTDINKLTTDNENTTLRMHIDSLREIETHFRIITDTHTSTKITFSQKNVILERCQCLSHVGLEHCHLEVESCSVSFWTGTSQEAWNLSPVSRWNRAASD